MTLNLSDARQLAQAFRAAAIALGNWWFANAERLDDGSRERIRAMHVSLVATASDLTLHAIGVTLAEGEADLAAIEGAAAKAKSTLETIQHVTKVIAIAAALLALATAIPTGNPAAIVGALQGLIGEVRE